MILVSPQLSQTAASIDNRVPTPSSVASAETNSQQPGPEVPLLEMKAEIKTEDTEPDAGEPKGEPGATVGAFPGHGWMCCTQRCHGAPGGGARVRRACPCVAFHYPTQLWFKCRRD